MFSLRNKKKLSLKYPQYPLLSVEHCYIFHGSQIKTQETIKIDKTTYVRVLRRVLSTDIVLQLECSSTLAVVSVESFTIPIYPIKIEKQSYLFCLQVCWYAKWNL